MASSVVTQEGDYRHMVRVGAMDFEALVIFTDPPPVGEDYFTVVAKKSLVKLPVGVIPDGRMTDSARLTPHILEFKTAKGRMPRLSTSYVFSRVERGKLQNPKKLSKNLSFICLFRLWH